MTTPAKAAPFSENAVVNGLMLGGMWSDPVITFNFLAGDINRNGIGDFDEGDWKSFYREIMDNVETFANISFREVSGRANINFRLDEGGGGESGVPVKGVVDVETAVGINANVAASAEIVRLGTYSVTWFHEIGHALGLKHPHEDDGDGFSKLPGVVEPGDQGTTYLNSQINTVMGYTSSFLAEDNPFTAEVDFGVNVNAQPGSYGAIDIAALQHLYGARAHNTGNNTYRFSDDVDFNHGYTTIWDTGGRDTIEYVGESRAKIDLREATLKHEIGGGGWASTSETLTGGFAIAHGVSIENATGGRGDDILTGNDLANVLIGGAGNDAIGGGLGNDRLDGGLGIDRLVGGAGNDTYSVDRAQDVVIEAANEGWDTILASADYTIAAGQSVETLRGAGNAGLSLNGNEIGNQIIGTVGADRLSGGQGNDRLTGDAGDDRLNGGEGWDQLTGGAGKDVFVFDAPLRQGVDRITDFSVPDDTIWLNSGVFARVGAPGVLAADAFWAAAGGKAHDASDRVIYDSASGDLFYDADGSGVGAATMFARLDPGLKLTAADFFVMV